MKVFVAGATGAIGRPLVHELLAAHHDVVALTRSPARAGELARLGVQPVVGNALASGVLDAAFAEHQPEVAVHQLTTFPTGLRPIKSLRQLRQTNRLRAEGARLMAAAAKRNGTRRVIAQSIAFLYRPGSALRSEEDAMIRGGRGLIGGIARGIAEVEDALLDDPDFEGVVLRYGGWYGPGTQFHARSPLRFALRTRLVPAFRRSTARFNTTFIADAATSVLAALDGLPGPYNINDNEPIPVAQIIDLAAQAFDAKPPVLSATWPLHAAGAYMRHLLLAQAPASNSRAANNLGWTPTHATAIEGLLDVLGRPPDPT